MRVRSRGEQIAPPEFSAVAAEPVLPADVINDNAKRSVSIRINTSDYGRIKVAARRLRTREAEVFRYLLQVGLSRIQPLLVDVLDTAAYLRALAELGPDLTANLGLSVRKFTALLNGTAYDNLPVIEEQDFELIDLAGTHPNLVLEQLRSAGATETDVRAALYGHLKRKYGGSA